MFLITLGIWLGAGESRWSNLSGQSPEAIHGWIEADNCWIAFTTSPAWIYRLEYSADLSSWAPLVENIPGTGGELQILDPEAVRSQTMRFYRVVRYTGPSQGEPPGNPNVNLWAWISPGTFTMGSTTNAMVRESDESPATATTLTQGFWMSRCEVRQEEYQAVMGQNPSWFILDPTQPVENVTWEEATNYCARLTAREQAAGRLPSGYHYRLPTEAEWEYACRAGSNTSYSFGDDPNGTELGHYAWYWDNSGSTNAPPGNAYVLGDWYYATRPAGTRQMNPWGLYDLHGSVWEWCLDWYGAYGGGTAVDPTGPTSGEARIVRGGSWDSGAVSCRSANRSAAYPQVRGSGLGFRPVLAPNS